MELFIQDQTYEKFVGKRVWTVMMNENERNSRVKHKIIFKINFCPKNKNKKKNIKKKTLFIQIKKNFHTNKIFI